MATGPGHGSNHSRELEPKKPQKLSQYTGVTKQDGWWKAQIYVDGKTVYLGDHREERSAAEAFDRACICRERDVKNFPIRDYNVGELRGMDWDTFVETERSAASGRTTRTSHNGGVSKPRKGNRQAKPKSNSKQGNKKVTAGTSDCEDWGKATRSPVPGTPDKSGLRPFRFLAQSPKGMKLTFDGNPKEESVERPAGCSPALRKSSRRSRANSRYSGGQYELASLYSDTEDELDYEEADEAEEAEEGGAGGKNGRPLRLSHPRKQGHSSSRKWGGSSSRKRGDPESRKWDDLTSRKWGDPSSRMWDGPSSRAYALETLQAAAAAANNEDSYLATRLPSTFRPASDQEMFGRGASQTDEFSPARPTKGDYIARPSQSPSRGLRSSPERTAHVAGLSGRPSKALHTLPGRYSDHSGPQTRAGFTQPGGSSDTSGPETLVGFTQPGRSSHESRPQTLAGWAVDQRVGGGSRGRGAEVLAWCGGWDALHALASAGLAYPAPATLPPPPPSPGSQGGGASLGAAGDANMRDDTTGELDLLASDTERGGLEDLHDGSANGADDFGLPPGPAPVDVGVGVPEDEVLQPLPPRRAGLAKPKPKPKRKAKAKAKKSSTAPSRAPKRRAEEPPPAPVEAAPPPPRPVKRRKQPHPAMAKLN